MNKPADPRATKLLPPIPLRNKVASESTSDTPTKGQKRPAKASKPAAPTSASAPAAKPYSPFGAKVRKTLDVEAVEARAAEFKAADADDTPFDVPTADGKTLKLRTPIDWQAVHAVYRTGSMTDAELARRFGCSHTSIQKTAKKLQWVRDQRENVLKKALGIDATVEVAGAQSLQPADSNSPQIVIEQQPITATTQDVIIEVLARAIARTRTEHRTGIKRFRALTERLFEDLEATVLNRPDFQTLGQLLADPEADGNLDAIYNGIISLPGQTKTLKELADVLYKLIDMERTAYRLDDPEVDPSKANRGIAVRFVEPVVRVIETTEQEKQHAPLKLMSGG